MGVAWPASWVPGRSSYAGAENVASRTRPAGHARCGCAGRRLARVSPGAARGSCWTSRPCPSGGAIGVEMIGRAQRGDMRRGTKARSAAQVTRWPWSSSSKRRGSPTAMRQSGKTTGTGTALHRLLLTAPTDWAIGRIVERGLTAPSIDPRGERPSMAPGATPGATGSPRTGTRRFPRQRMRSGLVTDEPAERMRAHWLIERTRIHRPVGVRSIGSREAPVDRILPDVEWA